MNILSLYTGLANRSEPTLAPVYTKHEAIQGTGSDLPRVSSRRDRKLFKIIAHQYRSYCVRIIMMGFFSSCLLCACSSAEDELTHYIHMVKSRPPKPRTIEPIPEFKPLEKFIFPMNDKRRSPFKPIQTENQIDVNSPNIKRPKQPLEAFPLDALSFVGILKQDHSIWGLMSQPGGLVLRVMVGDYMGKNYGRIVRIKDDSIDIEETVQVNGRWEKRKTTLNLHSLD